VRAEPMPRSRAPTPGTTSLLQCTQGPPARDVPARRARRCGAARRTAVAAPAAWPAPSSSPPLPVEAASEAASSSSATGSRARAGGRASPLRRMLRLRCACAVRRCVGQSGAARRWVARNRRQIEKGAATAAPGSSFRRCVSEARAATPVRRIRCVPPVTHAGAAKPRHAAPATRSFGRAALHTSRFALAMRFLLIRTKSRRTQWRPLLLVISCVAALRGAACRVAVRGARHMAAHTRRCHRTRTASHGGAHPRLLHTAF
jgi:hypothetical protein